jgi:hypothetical protein
MDDTITTTALATDETDDLATPVERHVRRLLIHR